MLFIDLLQLFFFYCLLSRECNLWRWCLIWSMDVNGEGNGTRLQYSCLENPMDGAAWPAAVHGVAGSRTRLSDFTFTFHFHALEKEMATRSSVLAWRIPGTMEPDGLPSMGSHRVGHNWSDLAAAAAAWMSRRKYIPSGSANVKSLRRNGVAVSEKPNEAELDGSLVGEGLPRAEGASWMVRFFRAKMKSLRQALVLVLGYATF